MATWMTFLSAALLGDESFYAPTVRIRGVVTQVRAHPKRLCVSLHWTFRGKPSTHLAVRFPATVDEAGTKKEKEKKTPTHITIVIFAN